MMADREEGIMNKESITTTLVTITMTEKEAKDLGRELDWIINKGDYPMASALWDLL